MQGGGANESPAAKAAAAAAATNATAEPQPDPGSSHRARDKQPDAAKMVKIVENLEEFQQALAAPGVLIVVDFSATWCGPCKMIKPFFHNLCEKFPEVVFLEVDVDDAQDIAQHCEVKCMPTFQFYKNNVKVHEFSGANKEKLEETIKSLK